MKIRRVVARTIADGVTGELYSGRVTAVNGNITQVEKGVFEPQAGDIVITDNKILAPAFIDAHGHSDLSLMAMPQASGKTSQGIAYEISGNCGLSPFPLTERNREHLQELYRQYAIELSWHDLPGYKACLQKYSPKLELFPQVGHNTLRAAAASYDKKKLSSDEMRQMLELLDHELTGGAIGLSFGLLYTPGCFADFEEIVSLMKVVAAHGKICTVHLKSEGNDLENALQTMLDAARAAGLKKLHLSHLKTAGKKNFHKINAIIEALQTPDIRVSGDVYCYDASMSQLSILLPAPYDEYDDITVSKLLQDPATFEHILQQVKLERAPEYWQNVRIISAADPYRIYEQKFFSEAAQQANIPPEQLFLEILRCNSAAARAAFHTLSQENMQLLAAHPSVVPGSDESARDAHEIFGSSHPRGFGNHAEYFALRRQQGASLAEIIREMTSLPAKIFDLSDIGSISNGKRAVFTVLEPENYQAAATFEQPHQLCCGAEILRLQDL